MCQTAQEGKNQPASSCWIPAPKLPFHGLPVMTREIDSNRHNDCWSLDMNPRCCIHLDCARVVNRRGAVQNPRFKETVEQQLTQSLAAPVIRSELSMGRHDIWNTVARCNAGGDHTRKV